MSEGSIILEVKASPLPGINVRIEQQQKSKNFVSFAFALYQFK